jgi:hypothetical protein
MSLDDQRAGASSPRPNSRISLLYPLPDALPSTSHCHGSIDLVNSQLLRIDDANLREAVSQLTVQGLSAFGQDTSIANGCNQLGLNQVPYDGSNSSFSQSQLS